MSAAAAQIAANLAAVRAQMAAAAARSGRPACDVRLVAVTKYVAPEIAGLLAAAGCCDLGESRPQELWRKHAWFVAQAPQAAVRWHLIGHLQRNKLARTVPLLSLLHSCDRLRLVEALAPAAAARGAPLDVLLEVNISGQAEKTGLAPGEVEPVLAALAAAPALRCTGLMCMAGLDDDPDSARRDFAALRALRDRLQPAWDGRFALRELSMGMSGDYVAAIEEGATLVRIGSALFAGLPARE